MKPLSAHSYLEAAALITIPVVGAFAIWLCWPLRSAIKSNSAGSAVVLAKVGTALDTVNAPCRDNGHQVVCGTLAQIAQTTNNIGILSAEGAEQIKQSGALITATAANLNQVGVSVTDMSTHFATLADAGTATLTQATTTVKQVGDKATLTLGTADTTIQAAQPLLGRATLFVGHADDDVVAFKPVLVNSQTLSHDAVVEEQKFTYPPKMLWYKKIVPTTLKVGELAYDFIR